MTSQQVNDELMSRRVLSKLPYRIYDNLPDYTRHQSPLSSDFYTSSLFFQVASFFWTQLLFWVAIDTSRITIIPNPHINGLNIAPEQGKTRNGCTLNRACVGPAKLRSAEIAKNRISGRNAKSLWLARLGWLNLAVKIFAGGKSAYIRVSSPVQMRRRIE